MPTGSRTDPFRAFNFLVEIDGITRAGFRECTGLETNQEPIDYRDGNDPPWVRKLSGLNSFPAITLRRGIVDSDLFSWRQKGVTGQVERKNVSIVLFDETGKEEKMRWNLQEAWATKWTGPSFNAVSNEVAVESVEIVHEGITRA